MISSVWDTYNSQDHRDRKWNGDCQGLGRRGNGELVFNAYRISGFQDEKSYRDRWLHNIMNVLTELYT